MYRCLRFFNNKTTALKKIRRHISVIAAIPAIAVLLFSNIEAQTFPAGFNQVMVANGINNPTVMAFAPDGRIFVAQQGGQIKVIKNGYMLAWPFAVLNVNSSGERGLLGIAFDPDFNNNKYVYVYYTVASATNNRISRLTANGDVAVQGSEVVILDLDSLSTATHHNGGTMQFGPDGKLYVGIGDNNNSANAQNLNTYHGKILRINSDGSVPAGNPYTSGSNQKKRVWSCGLRNPFTIAFQPSTGRLFANDVGQSSWEEVDDATTPGLNFGWPNTEGNNASYNYTNPLYAYAHGTGSALGCAITGGTFFNPSTTNYPSMYSGKYFLIDYCGNWIDMLTLNGSTVVRSDFCSGISGSPVGIVTGTDGNLYFLSRDIGALYKITYTGTSTPVITMQPQSISVAQGNTATFSVTATSTLSLSYQWYKNGTKISGAKSSTYIISPVISAKAGTYSVIVSNSAANVQSTNATLTVTAANQPPTATIIYPASGTTYAAGNMINFSGSATDPEDSMLPASAFTWYVILHHDNHTHPGPSSPSGVTSGSFVIPNNDETSANVFYRLYLVVTDSQGATDTTYTDLIPRTSTITLNTNPQGLIVKLDGQPFTTPLTVTCVEGVLRTIDVVTPQTFNGLVYNFSSWSQGGAQLQTFATPVNNVSYTANFTTPAVTTLNPVADAYVRSGSYANSNFGNSWSLGTKNTTGANANYLTYLRFDISSIYNIASAKLRVYGHLNNTSDPSIIVRVFNVTSQTWVEKTITYSNKPAEQTPVIGSVTVTGTSAKYYEVDLTQYLINQRNSGASTVSLLLKNSANSSSRVIFNSRENATYRPELRITAPRKNETVPAVQSFTVYPNPANDYFTICYPSEFINSRLKIIDALGKIVNELPLTSTSSQNVQSDALSDGLYFLIIEDGNKSYSQKIVIKK